MAGLCNMHNRLWGKPARQRENRDAHAYMARTIRLVDRGAGSSTVTTRRRCARPRRRRREWDELRRLRVPIERAPSPCRRSGGEEGRRERAARTRRRVPRNPIGTPPARTKNYIGRTYERAMIRSRRVCFWSPQDVGGGSAGVGGKGVAPAPGPRRARTAVPRQGPSSPAAARPCCASISS